MAFTDPYHTPTMPDFVGGAQAEYRTRERLLLDVQQALSDAVWTWQSYGWEGRAVFPLCMSPAYESPLWEWVKMRLAKDGWILTDYYSDSEVALYVRGNTHEQPTPK